MTDGKESRGEGPEGEKIDFDALEKELIDSLEKREDRERAERIKREADRISSLILYSDLPKVDVEIAIRNFRREVLELFPDKEELFNGLYLNRFRRLWKQFRSPDEELL